MTRLAHPAAPRPLVRRTLPHFSTGQRAWAGSLTLLLLLAATYGLWVRPWHLRWGATDQEIAMPLPGDPWIVPEAEVSTRALNIQAPPAQVWPWVAYLGQERGGFYSYHWLENLFVADMPNVVQLPDETQWLDVGDRISYMGNGPQGTYATVDYIEPGHVLVAGGWTWIVEPVGENQTRLVVRYPFPLGPEWMGRLFYYTWFEPAHFVMEAGMMLGIKQRAEAAAGGRP